MNIDLASKASRIPKQPLCAGELVWKQVEFRRTSGAYSECSEMLLFLWFREIIASIIALLSLSAVATLADITKIDGVCQAMDNNTIICNINCFEDIPQLLPSDVNRSTISNLIVNQIAARCDVTLASEVVKSFTNLRQLHYSGVKCPFSELPNIRKFTQMTFMTTSEYLNEDHTVRRNSENIEVPEMKKLIVNFVCCGLFTRNIIAPQLEHLSFRCPRISSYVTGSNYTRKMLTFITPMLRSLEYLESGLDFPASGVSDLPHLRSLFVYTNQEFYEATRATPRRSLNLPKVRELVYSQGELGHTLGSSAYQCVELGAQI